MPGIDYHELKRIVSMETVLDVIQWKPLRAGGRELRGPCPIHGSTGPRSRIFSVDPEGRRFNCFKCHACGNHFDLFVQVTKLDLHAAAIELCRRAGIDVPFLKSREQRREPVTAPSRTLRRENI